MKRFNWLTAPRCDLSSFRFFGVKFSDMACTFELIGFIIVWDNLYPSTNQLLLLQTCIFPILVARLHCLVFLGLVLLLQSDFLLIIWLRSIYRLGRRLYSRDFPILDPLLFGNLWALWLTYKILLRTYMCRRFSHQLSGSCNVLLFLLPVVLVRMRIACLMTCIMPSLFLYYLVVLPLNQLSDLGLAFDIYLSHFLCLLRVRLKHFSHFYLSLLHCDDQRLNKLFFCNFFHFFDVTCF